MSKVSTKIRIRRNRILRALLEHGELSLTDLARITGMGIPMVSSIIASEKHGRFIRTREEKTADRAGRPPILARLNGTSGFVIGIDIGHLNANMVVLNLAQEVVAFVTHPSPPLREERRVVEWIRTEVNGIVAENSLRMDRLLGVGVSIPGIVRGREGIGETYLHFGGRPVREILHGMLDKPVHVEHDAKAMALGELWFGAARRKTNALCLNIGWGLGLGIILDGRLFYGRDGYAGEFGHIETIPDGQLCYCGRKGCLETVASGQAIGAAARERVKNGTTSKLTARTNGRVEAIDAQMVVELANSGDQFCIEILDQAGRYLGEGLASLITLFNPEVIVLGGRVSGAGNFILNPVRTTAVQHSLVQLSRDVEFLISPLGAKAGSLGVAMLAARDLFEVEHLNPSAFV
jgi:glucokinase-like ROK family protein